MHTPHTVRTFLIAIALGTGLVGIGLGLRTSLQTAQADTASEYLVITGASDSGRNGLVAMSSVAEPALTFEASAPSGEASIDLYRTTEEALLHFLVHDSEYKQLHPTPDAVALTHVVTLKQSLAKLGDGTATLLPLDPSGLYYVKVTQGSITAGAFVVRSKTAVLVKEADQSYLFWGQDFETKRSIDHGQIRLYNLKDRVARLGEGSFVSEGTAEVPLDIEANVAVVERDGDRAIVPVNLHDLGSPFANSRFERQKSELRTLLFTDRPLYRPGDTIYYKSVLREHDDVRYGLPKGLVQVRLYESYVDPEQLVAEESRTISGAGSIDGSFELPAASPYGDYVLALEFDGADYTHDEWESRAYLQVQEYRTPEYALTLTAPKLEYVAGEPITATLAGQYHLGAPLAGVEVEYRVRTADFYEYGLATQEAPSLGDLTGYWSDDKLNTAEGAVALDESGQATVTIDPITTDGRSRVAIIEAQYVDASGTVAVTRQNVLVHAGEFGIFRADDAYSGRVGTPLEMKVQLARRVPEVELGSVAIKATVKRTEWISKVSSEDSKYPRYTYTKQEEELPSIEATTDASGQASLKLTPHAPGSYSFALEVVDARGNVVRTDLSRWVTEAETPVYDGEDSPLQVQVDRSLYQPDETATVTVTSSIPDRDVLVSLDRNRLHRYQIVHLAGTTGQATFPLQGSDLPNIYAVGTSFSDRALDSDLVNIALATTTKRLKVSLSADKTILGPGDTVALDVRTEDSDGQPVATETTVWVVDKAIYQLADETRQDSFATFWREQYVNTSRAHSLEGISSEGAERGGCFLADTAVLVPGGRTVPIQSIRVGDSVLTRRSATDATLVPARVTGVHTREVAGYLTVNGTLRVTSNHRLFVNGRWQNAGSLQAGDRLLDPQGRDVIVESLSWHDAVVPVYNLTVARAETFFADGVWAHNSKDGDVRTNFADTAYWNPTVRTDRTGHARVVITLPDNLTTWVAAAVGVSEATQAGQTEIELVATQPLVVRPILPSLLRVGDRARIATLIHNFTDTEQAVTVTASADEAVGMEPAAPETLTIPARQARLVSWSVVPTAALAEAAVTVTAKGTSGDLGDAVTRGLPIEAFGWRQQSALTGVGSTQYSVALAPDAHKDRSSATLSLSPSLVGLLPSAMEYLMEYAYGCVEQTVSRFVPAILALEHLDRFGATIPAERARELVEQGLVTLARHQQGSGGWGWWRGQNESPFVSAYVAEHLVRAKDLGLTVSERMLGDLRTYHERELERQSEKLDAAALVAHRYGLAWLGSTAELPALPTPASLSPDLLALAVLASDRARDTTYVTAGIASLLARAHEQGDRLSWDAGAPALFGSRTASTALVLRALIAAETDQATLTRAVRTLSDERTNSYWSNTFGTAQVSHALTAYAAVTGELDEAVNYTVSQAGTELASGTLQPSDQERSVPLDKVVATDQSIQVESSGQGQLYSTFMVDQFRTDPEAAPERHGLELARAYRTERGTQFGLGVGDVVSVELTVSGLDTAADYVVIEDALPAGLVPVNEALNNEPLFESDRVTAALVSEPEEETWVDRQATRTGMVLSLSRLEPGTHTYTYRARALTEGSFLAPPARASLMYQPEVWAQTAPETVQIAATGGVVRISKLLPSILEDTTRSPWLYAAAAAGGLALGGVLAWLRRRRTTRPGSSERLA